MSKEVLIYSIAGFLVGGLLVGFTATLAVNNDNREVMQMLGMNTSRIMNAEAGHMGMSMNQMAAELQNRTGDDFDENYVAMMIAHHQGAIDMARLAETRAKHDEIKQLSEDIISIQTKEIENMKLWQPLWGYNEGDSSMHNMH